MKQLLALALAAVFASVGAAAQTKNPMVVLETSEGTIKIELFEDKAPITVKNFLSYVDDKFYDNLLFHRVMSNFMIQGGGFDLQGREKTTKDPITNESGISNSKGTIAMARTMDPDSATSQFFINVKDNNQLNKSANSAGYCVFGKVVEGMNVVQKIENVKTTTKKIGDATHENWPVEDVVLKSARRAK